MTNEKRYEAIVEMLRCYDMATGNGGAENVLRNPEQWISCKYQPFYASAASMVIDLRTSMDSKKSGLVSIAAVKRFYKTAAKTPKMAGIITIEFDSEKRYALIDGHRILLSKIDYDCIPHLETEKCISPDAIKKICDDVKAETTGELLNLPSITEIKTFIAEHKSTDPKKTICIGENIYVNPQYLLDFIQAMPNIKAYKPAKTHSPIWLECETSEGLLLPCHVA